MNAFNQIKTITKRELTGYFASPVAYVFIVIFLLLAGFFTFMVSQFFQRDEASLSAFFVWQPWLYLFLVPAVGMRLWSLSLWQSIPAAGKQCRTRATRPACGEPAARVRFRVNSEVDQGSIEEPSGWLSHRCRPRNWRATSGRLVRAS